MLSKEDTKQLTVIVPAYNEEAAIKGVIEELSGSFPGASIIVVNDGSTDGTGDILRKMQGIRMLEHTRNRGCGAALKTGMKAASTGIIAWYDGDGQHRPEDLTKIVETILSSNKDAVIGSRQAGSDTRAERLVGKLILRWIVQCIAGTEVSDFNSGLRCFRADVIRRYLHLLPDGFSASTTSTLLMIKRGYNLAYEPIVTRSRKGKSTVRVFRDGLLTLKFITRLLILFEAFKFFSFLGLLQIALGLVYGFYMASAKKMGFPTLGAIITISGVLTFFMGIIAGQISELRKERFEPL